MSASCSRYIDVVMYICCFVEKKKQHLTIIVYVSYSFFCVCTVHNVMFCVIFA